VQSDNTSVAAPLLKALFFRGEELGISSVRELSTSIVPELINCTTIWLG